MADGHSGGPRGTTVRNAVADAARTVRRADVAIAYCVTVAVLAVVLELVSPATRRRVVAETSSNLDNLRDSPFQSLLASAFVVPHLGGLVLVAVLLVVLAYSQRFIGRAAAIVVGLAGHVGATVIVALALRSGIFHGLIDRSVRDAADVGVSYVLACSMAFLTLFVPRGRRWLWTTVLVLAWVLPGAVGQSFVDAGHATALVIGWLVAFVCWRAVLAHVRHLGYGREWQGRGAPSTGRGERESDP